MSLTLLLEKYDVSTEEGLQKALQEIEKEELEVDEALSGVLSKACSLEGRLRTASQAYTRLSEVKADAQVAADMVDRTAGLARDVSAKVRQLDLARSRVAECQRRVHDLIDLQLCSAGVEAAIKAQDYETAAGHVSRYLSMDPGAVAALDPRAALPRAAAMLRDLLTRRFEEAAKKEDNAAIEKLFKLFPQIGHAEEGMDLFAKYLATQAEGAIRRASVVPSGATGPAHAEALSRVVEAGAAAVERARAAARAAGGRALLPRALTHIQPQVCAGARRVWAAWSARVGGAGSGASGGAAGVAGRGPLAAEPVLHELALALARLHLYFNFLRRKAQMDAAELDEAAKKGVVDEVETIISQCDLTRLTQDILGEYLTLERYFLEESVSKALKMSTPQPGATTSSLVDDVFFIAKKVITRCVSSGSVEGVCAVVNEVGGVLERECAAALRRRVRAAPPDALPLPAPPAHAAAHAVTDTSRDLDAQRALFLAHAAEAECGAEWAEQLAADALQCAAALCRSQTDADKLASCCAGLGAAAAAFRAAADLALAALGAAIHPRLVLWADFIARPTCDLMKTDAPDVDDLEDESDADALPLALDALSEAARSALPPRAADALLLAALTQLAARAEARLTHYTYTRTGGLLVERRARRLAAWAGACAGAARERCARLARAAALLALERPQHAAEALAAAPALAPAIAKEILARRVDFKMEDIKRLKL